MLFLPERSHWLRIDRKKENLSRDILTPRKMGCFQRGWKTMFLNLENDSIEAGLICSRPFQLSGAGGAPVP
jgi:hypothetical protein